MNILFIACYSPLINNSASIETLMYLNSLCSIKENKIHLLTVDFPKNSIYYDENILKMLDKKVIIHKVSGGKVFNKIIPKKAGLSNNKDIYKASKKNIILRNIKNKIIFPDMYYLWSKKACDLGKEIIKSESIDIIFSMHEPPSSHLCALNLKKKFKTIPWVTYWSDPWMQDSTRENIGFIRGKIEGNMEKEVVKNSDSFIFVTKQNADAFKHKYNIQKEKIHLLTRGYDEKLYEKLSKEEIPSLIVKEKINIVYTGEIFKKLRNIQPFIEALEEIRINENDLYKKLNIMFFGNIDDENLKLRLNNLEVANVNSRIPFNKALKYMINSEILLIFGNKNSKQIPAKIYDYFGARGFIQVILGDENDPLKHLTDKNEKCKVSLNNKEDIIKSLKQNIEKIKRYKESKPLEEYKWENVTKKLYNILKEVEK